ncbi:DNA glycosylase [Truncatella angustata]|uniref:Adenine DNA glycosylase n=1 Tax=Truncatella angustata TaxID=152316 RepID=A0A9P8UQW0_9PEZI|nr:DNA glycosylase [Truncatella angustata]KAH6656802.1 DNA glycosylase [Truncatella angustata]
MRRSTRLVSSSRDVAGISNPLVPPNEQGKAPKLNASSRNKRPSPADSDAFESEASEPEEHKPVKRQKTSRSVPKRNHGSSEFCSHLFGSAAANSAAPPEPCTLPQRHHNTSYHRPLLLDRRPSRSALLKWFDDTSTARGMPWRKDWIDPKSILDSAELRSQHERRAYEVWISEIMLQQTRVAVVIDYWNRWMAKWPTIHDLAAASPDDVLAMWRGLGYYSRATRIHEAAKLVCGDAIMNGLLPDDVIELEKKVPGVGRYTAGAITAIVFGKASAMVDGNVLRVLSRQLGVLGDVKTDKATIGLLWMAAQALVNAVARDGDGNAMLSEGRRGEVQEQTEASDRPGRWGQALMELGSTVCTPKPNCAACPITTTCRAYAEGLQHATRERPGKKVQSIADIEDACAFCNPFEEYADLDNGGSETATKASSKSKGVTAAKGSKKQASLQSFFFTQHSQTSTTKPKTETLSSERPDAATFEKISNHARKFPIKTVKKAVREEETVVCAIQRKSDGQYLIQKRPEKGLLAGLWELPSHMLPDPDSTNTKARKAEAVEFVQTLVGKDWCKQTKPVKELGSVPWLFSHIKLTMHVYLFTLEDEVHVPTDDGIGKRTRWTKDVEGESMGTGMRKCWSLVKDCI